jgi:hypothetical protein
MTLFRIQLRLFVSFICMLRAVDAMKMVAGSGQTVHLIHQVSMNHSVAMSAVKRCFVGLKESCAKPLQYSPDHIYEKHQKQQM